MASISGHSHQGQAHSRLSEHDSRPPVSAKSANNAKVESPPQDRDSNLRDMGNSCSGHVCHSPQHPSSPVYPIPEPQALAIDALSQDWQGRPMYMFPPFPLLNKVIQKLKTTQDGEIILIAPWWPSQLWFPHLLCLFVDHPCIIPYCRDLLSQQGYVLDGKSTICTHGGSQAALPGSRIFRSCL